MYKIFSLYMYVFKDKSNILKAKDYSISSRALWFASQISLLSFIRLFPFRIHYSYLLKNFHIYFLIFCDCIQTRFQDVTFFSYSNCSRYIVRKFTSALFAISIQLVNKVGIRQKQIRKYTFRVN